MTVKGRTRVLASNSPNVIIVKQMTICAPQGFRRGFFYAIATVGLIIVVNNPLLSAQEMATGGKAVPARPLPSGVKAPSIDYHDIAVPAGLVGINVSGSEKGKQYRESNTLLKPPELAWLSSITTTMVFRIFFW